MSEIIYNFPPSIHFGWGELANLAQYVKTLNGKHVFIVTDQGLVMTGILGIVEERLQEVEIEYTIFDGVQPNPTYKNVHEGLTKYREHECDLVLAVGGGSPMDAAKAILVMTRHPGELANYYSGAEKKLQITDDLPPFLVVPTTSGTGSEVSRGAIITDDKNRKRAIGSRHLLPKTVILDPSLTVSMPSRLTAFTGLDALSHNLEAYAVDRYAPLADAFAKEGINLVAKSLVKAQRDGSDQTARMDLMMASTMGALAFMKGLGVIHSLAHQLSTQCDIPHGAACGIMTPHAIRYNLDVKSTWPKYKDMAKTFTGDPNAKVKDAPMVIEKLLENLGVETSLSEWGVTDEDIEIMSSNAMLDHCHPRNPRKCTQETMRNLYEAAL
ncbi:MAG: iron-containing alcohol dehydrogenase [Candidatus Bathyarchaeota archaeon]|nr:iron-containing alcohol dehydrogenase [Candidatus Bathyarchaeota archaeon]